MKSVIGVGLLSIVLLACSQNKNLAQSKRMSADELIQYINKSKSDTEYINPKLKALQKESDLIISFATLNYAWARRASYYVLAKQKGTWKTYRYDSKLPPVAEDAYLNMSGLDADSSAAGMIAAMYVKAKLWNTSGDDSNNPCPGKKNCNINDAESWTLSVATKNNIHTTSYYAPEFFEECCPGNKYRADFISVAKAMMELVQNTGAGTEK